MSAVGKRRLRKLIAFLRQLPRRKFDFSDVVKETNGKGCGSVACALGWTPVAFPKHFKWIDNGGYASRRGSEGIHLFRDAADYFQIPRFHDNLFVPAGAWAVSNHLPNLNGDATPKQVARMLEQYIKLTETPV